MKKKDKQKKPQEDLKESKSDSTQPKEKKTLKQRLESSWVWLRKNLINKDMIVPFILAELIFWSPNIITALLAILIDPWFWTAFGAICAFWAGPFTPAMPLQFGLAVAIKKLMEKIKNGRRNKNRD